MRLGSFFKQEGIGGKKEDRDIRFFLSPTLVREYPVRVILKGLPGPQALGILSLCLFLSPNRGVAGGVMQKVSKMLNAPLPHYGATLCRQLRRVKFTLLRFLFFFLPKLFLNKLIPSLDQPLLLQEHGAWQTPSKRKQNKRKVVSDIV